MIKTITFKYKVLIFNKITFNKNLYNLMILIYFDIQFIKLLYSRLKIRERGFTPLSTLSVVASFQSIDGFHKLTSRYDFG